MGYVLGSYLCPHDIRNFGHVRSFSVLAAMGCVSVILHGLIIDPIVWLILCIITGICMLGMYLVIESWISSLATNKTSGGLCPHRFVFFTGPSAHCSHPDLASGAAGRAWNS